MIQEEKSDRQLAIELQEVRAALAREAYGPTARWFQRVVHEVKERGPRLRHLLHSFTDKEVAMSG